MKCRNKPQVNGGAVPPHRSSIDCEADNSACKSLRTENQAEPDIGGARRTRFLAASEATTKRLRKMTKPSAHAIPIHCDSGREGFAIGDTRVLDGAVTGTVSGTRLFTMTASLALAGST